ncbi:hypothetical protein BS47DRAFT_1367617 [Hydnum rufescens UP504]|uniref:Uncharacterized protein n=1 Tax=Hydnum rufescens UP504 TaxID=1448309 RepID=A0A9P6DP92_9AGAM|nr:hypothetical protein BS47DRAFT_1367617 [Hydnum rufescens UP504]
MSEQVCELHRCKRIKVQRDDTRESHQPGLAGRRIGKHGWRSRPSRDILNMAYSDWQGPVQATGPTVNRQAMAPLPLKWPATSPPSPDEEVEGTTHPLGRMVPHTRPSRMVPHPRPFLIGRVLNMQMGNQKARLGRPQIYV